MRVLVVGIDGGTFKVIEPFVKMGVMPRIQRAMETGTYCTARSVTPVNSAAAWSTIITGLNPGKHGVYYFRDLKRTASGPEWGKVIDSRSIDGETIWKTLSRYGLRVCVANVPITFPPEEVNGVFISGLLTPSLSSHFTYPDSLKDELQDYSVDISFSEETRQGTAAWYEEVLEQVKSVTAKRSRNILRIVKSENWDFVMVVFRETDDIQHFMWDVLSENLAGGELSGIFSRIVEYYALLDKSIGELIDAQGEGSNTLIISDHGFGRAPSRTLDLDVWARSRGLQYLRGPSSTFRLAATTLIRRSAALNQLSKPLELLGRFSGAERRLTGSVKRTSGLVDWERTSAFKYGEGLALNRDKVPSSDDRQMETIRKDLLSIHDPENGKKPVAEVLSRDALYNGPYAQIAPEIVLILAQDYKLASIPGLSLFEDAPWSGLSGEHDRHGVFIASGPNIKNLGGIDSISIVDFYPTVMKLFGIEPRKELDGRPLTEMMSDLPPTRSSTAEEIPAGSQNTSATGFTAEEEERLGERLSKLGYF